MSDGGDSHGIIFDVQRSALHDGPGIRTTIFLKGCPLRCAWCHNPESMQPEPQLMVDPHRCTDCGACVQACPNGEHIFSDGHHKYDHAAGCERSGQCVSACPNGAIRMAGRVCTVSELMAIVLRDRLYYERSGGGITLSGGEPMAQFQFTLDLLIAAKKAGVHTCLDTSGMAPREHFVAVLPWVDLFLFDYKVTGEEAHRRWTGASPALILQNLDFLNDSGAAIILRCPIVPGVNDGCVTVYAAIAVGGHPNQ